MEEWKTGHDQFSKATQKQLCKNRDELIRKREGYIAPVPSNKYKEGWDRIWGKK